MDMKESHLAAGDARWDLVFTPPFHSCEEPGSSGEMGENRLFASSLPLLSTEYGDLSTETPFFIHSPSVLNNVK